MRKNGVFQLPLTKRDKLHSLLNFEEPARIPETIKSRAKAIAELGGTTKARKALIQCPSFMVASLESELEELGIVPYYAYGTTNIYIKEDKDRGTPQRGVKWHLQSMFASQDKLHMLDDDENDVIRLN
jgi:hypothetical protein